MPLDRDTAVRMLVSGRSSLLGYIYSIVRDWQMADDVFQELSILLLRKCDAIRDAAAFGSWVRSAARLEAMNILRKRSRRPTPLGDAIQNLLDAAWDASDAETPDQLDSLRACMKELTERARHILHLRYSEDIKGEALAEVLRQPPNTVYVALSRIHKRLAACIERRAEEQRRAETSGQSPFGREDAR
ncbi:MAG: sigma-70 family RNA polymerase sigma factor [Pirellulales bacterium]|nr:sigma-70 family RNA polymerase sigma factor [Pirellulales bacterium]